MPRPSPALDTDQDAFQARKKARLETMKARKPGALRRLAFAGSQVLSTRTVMPPPKPMASAPTSHEVSGFMPGRLEFEQCVASPRLDRPCT